MKSFHLQLSALLFMLLPVLALTEDSVLEEVLVTAEFRAVSAADLAASVSVFDQQAIDRRGALHLDQLLNLAPNVNFASGASRGRFIQIRGSGERSQFVEPVNPSVGLIIDGMDFTGITGAATTLDVRQVEILRGPQGTLFGANALAGLINVVSNGPSDTTGGRAELILGNYGQRTLNAAVGGAITSNTGYRLAVQSNRSDGFIRNVFLDENTNYLDEGTARGKLSWDVTPKLHIGINGFYTDVDNGYDAFSLDNTRETYSDHPGHDRLEAIAGAITARWESSDTLAWEALLSHVDADTDYGYDEDWSHPGICDDTACDTEIWGFDWWYASTDNYLRSNSNTTFDIRVASDAGPNNNRWVAGLYYRDQTQDLLREYTYADGDFGSRYDTRNLAAYGQLDVPFANSWTLVAGLRFETRDWAFDDNTPEETAASDNESDWGGKLALEYRTNNGTLIYGLVSRGYKAGGYNTALASKLPDLEEEGISIDPAALVFGTESLLNLELGLKGSWLAETLEVSAALFYQERDDMQVKQSIVIASDPANGACPCVFIDSLQNAAGGSNYGLELQAQWLATENFILYGSLGLLRTEYTDFRSFTHTDADLENGQPYDLSGRDQAHAPRFQYSVGARWFFATNWMLQTDVEGKDSFYASANHNETLHSYHLVNLRLAWESERWGFAAWGRNLADQDVQTRGFGGFGNDPRKLYAVEPYYQLGEPRVYGITGWLKF